MWGGGVKNAPIFSLCHLYAILLHIPHIIKDEKHNLCFYDYDIDKRHLYSYTYINTYELLVITSEVTFFNESTVRQSKFETNYISAPSENVVMQLCSSFQICFVALYIVPNFRIIWFIVNGHRLLCQFRHTIEFQSGWPSICYYI